MILSTCKAGDKYYSPRNVHKSAINAFGSMWCIPIYIEMSVDPKIGIALGLENDRVAHAIKEHPDAKANPNQQFQPLWNLFRPQGV